MSDQPITLAVLAKFHRDVIVPDIQRIVGDAVSGSEGRLRNEMQGFHDSIVGRLGKLETEYEAIRVGLKRVEDRLDKVEERLGRVEGRLELVESRLSGVEESLDVLATDLRHLQERLSRVEKGLDDLATAESRSTLRSEVEDLKASIAKLQARIDALEARVPPPR